MKLIKSYLTNNPCYTANINKNDIRYTNFQKNGPSGLMLHSVGCPQPTASIFIKLWNKPTYTKACVHAFIDSTDGTVYQTLPWNYRGWHGGGSSNDTHIGIEMCEPDCIKYSGGNTITISNKKNAQDSVKHTYNVAVELFAKLCIQYNLNPLTDICSHAEGYRKGIATNHGDPEHLWKGVGLSYTMDSFRSEVKKKMDNTDNINSNFRVKVAISDLNIRKGPGTNYDKTGKYTGKGEFTIIEVKSGAGSKSGWGKLKSGQGWISLDYTTKV